MLARFQTEIGTNKFGSTDRTVCLVHPYVIYLTNEHIKEGDGGGGELHFVRSLARLHKTRQVAHENHADKKLTFIAFLQALLFHVTINLITSSIPATNGP